MIEYKNLSPGEKEQLLKFPAYISLLAAAAENGLDRQEKQAVVKLTHIRTYFCDPLIADYYKEVDREFDKTITALNNELPKTAEERRLVITRELRKMDIILKKLGEEYGIVLRHSMQNYKNYVSRAHRNILEYFIFPLPISGLTD